jgi:hypothetical protein
MLLVYQILGNLSSVKNMNIDFIKIIYEMGVGFGI